MSTRKPRIKPPSKRRESAESRAFRRHMTAAAPDQAGKGQDDVDMLKKLFPSCDAEIDKLAREDPDLLDGLLKHKDDVLSWFAHGVVDVNSVNSAAIVRICDFVRTLDIDGERTPLVHPRVSVANAAIFDSALCKAGLKRYVRSRHQTETDHSTTFVLVTELEQGVWSKQEISWGPDAE